MCGENWGQVTADILIEPELFNLFRKLPIPSRASLREPLGQPNSMRESRSGISGLIVFSR